jgi:hypothetical protein
MKVGDHVYKLGGYTFTGVVRAIFPKADGQLRVVVEMDRPNLWGGDSGLLHIFNVEQLEVNL